MYAHQDLIDLDKIENNLWRKMMAIDIPADAPTDAAGFTIYAPYNEAAKAYEAAAAKCYAYREKHGMIGMSFERRTGRWVKSGR